MIRRHRHAPPLLLLTAALALGGAAAPAATAAPPPASAAASAPTGTAGTTALRTGMSWTVLGQQDGYTHFGADGLTNPYSGDTTVDQYLPTLCLLVDGQPAPGGIAFDFYNGWAGGAAKATAPVRGDALTSQQRGDEICAENFGAGWRLAEFHDGRYGPDFGWSGGWTFWAASGQLMPGARYWVAINDQPANAWNSTGDLPPPVEGQQPEDLVIKTRLQEIVQPLLSYAADPRFRDLVDALVAQQFDGDTNALLGDVVAGAEAGQLVDPDAGPWQAIKATIATLQALGEGYQPQIYIPNYGDGAVPDPQVSMVLLETDPNRTTLPAYELDGAGGLRLKDTLVDEDYTEAHEVWVLSVNEGVPGGAESTAVIHTGATTGGAAGVMAACRSDGLRFNRGEEYLQKIMLPDLGAVEPWISGKVELRLAIIGKGGQTVVNYLFPKIKRKKLKNQAWLDMDQFITTWDRTELGSYWAYQWYEINKGPRLQSFTLNFSAAWKEKLEISAGASVSITLEPRHKELGGSLVGFLEPTTIEYGTPLIHWYVCSSGGVEENLAILANASASSTYPFEGYSPARVNDGSRSTALGGADSWVNADRYAPNGFLPQWVQLDFGAPTTFNTVVVYTSQGYPIRDYEVQILNAAGVWQRISIRTGNTNLMVIHQLAQSYTARFVRVLGTRGPAIQPQYVRVNEFEVYNR